jgi:thioredoxin 1
MAGANVTELSSQTWDQEVTKSDQLVLVDFWAPWCGPCRVLGPTIDRIATQFAGRIKVGKLNTDDNQDLAMRYDITGIPALLFFKGGTEPVQRLVGVQPESTIVSVINRLLGT